MIIQLEPWEYTHACNIGIGRYTANWGKQDAPHYKKALMEDDRTATVASAICELAVAKATNIRGIIITSFIFILPNYIEI